MFDITAFSKPLSSKLHKHYIEQLVFLILNHLFTQEMAGYILKDEPDLQNRENAIGIEITEAILDATAQINGEFTKYRIGKKTADAQAKCLRIIRQRGAKLDGIGISYPMITGIEERSLFCKALKKKLNKLPAYKAKGFTKMGLFIYFDEPPIPFEPSDSLAWFIEAQRDSNEKYDFLFLGYRDGVIHYNLCSMEYRVYPLDSKVFYELSYKARIAVET